MLAALIIHLSAMSRSAFLSISNICVTCFLLLTPAVALSQAKRRRPPVLPSQTNNSSERIAAELRDAVQLLSAGKLAEAEPIIRSVIASSPGIADAHNLLGVILDQRGRFPEAEREYREALRLNPQGISTRANLGVLLARTGRATEAIAAFESVLQVVPEHPQATLNLGLQYAIRGDDERAIVLLRRAIALNLDSFEVQYHLGVSLYNRKHFDEATTALESALALSPNEAGPYYYLGSIAWAKGHDEQAANFWDTSVRLRPNFPEAQFMLGEVLRKNQRASASIEFYRRALEQDATKFVYYARLGATYILLGQTDQALAVFHSGVQRFPSLPEAHYFAGIAARATADYALSETELRKSLALDSNNVNALAQLGFVLLERGRPAEAETTLRRAININDKHFYANYDLGRLLVRSHRYDQALPILEHAVTLKPNNPGVHYQLFMALSRLKRKDDADRELATFKQLDEARKARPRSETGVEEDDLQNPAAKSSPSKPPQQ